MMMKEVELISLRTQNQGISSSRHLTSTPTDIFLVSCPFSYFLTDVDASCYCLKSVSEVTKLLTDHSWYKEKRVLEMRQKTLFSFNSSKENKATSLLLSIFVSIVPCVI